MLLSGLLVTEDGIRSLKKLEVYVEKPFIRRWTICNAKNLEQRRFYLYSIGIDTATENYR
jgi:DNA modification methylase